ncbi:sulfatase-like hydrolase/transferase [Acidobacteriota bacterium]
MNRSALSRRDLLKLLGIGTASLSLPLNWHCRPGMDRPNFLFIFTDDQRFNTIHALGNTEVHTPHMDRLVRRGVSFTNAYIMGGNSGAVCMPSRAMLLTGRSLFRIERDGRHIPEDHVMMPEILKAEGYSTFGTGKWHNGRDAFARCFSQGDEIFFGGMSDHWNVPVNEFDPTGRYETQVPFIPNAALSNKVDFRPWHHIPEGKHSSELFADSVVDFIKKYDSPDPFFVYTSFTAPHDPRSAPPEFMEMYDPKNIQFPPNFLPVHPFDNGELKVRDEMLASFPRTKQEVSRHIAEYYGIISHLDSQVGRILDALESSGQADNTYIIFAADNGLALGQHGLMGKQNVYDHSVHVPLIFSGPGLPQGERRDALCYLFDIFPTVCEIGKLPCPPSVEGKSLIPLIQNAELEGREALIFAYKDYQRGLRTRRWKLIQTNVVGSKHTQLFDMEKDPFEMDDLAGNPEHQARIKELSEMLQSMMSAEGDSVRLDQQEWGIKS